jgi:molybdopterin synthase sulfur carrier subunit
MATVTIRLFATARVAAGTGSDVLDGTTVGDVLSAARGRYGPGFAEVLAGCRIWRNGEPADPADEVADNDEVAVLPPVSGG